MRWAGERESALTAPWPTGPSARGPSYFFFFILLFAFAFFFLGALDIHSPPFGGLGLTVGDRTLGDGGNGCQGEKHMIGWLLSLLTARYGVGRDDPTCGVIH